MSFLDKLKNTAPDLKPLLGIYSLSGCGKTTLAAGFWPKQEEVLFLIGSADPGLLDLMGRGLIPSTTYQIIESWEELRKTVSALTTETHPFKFVAIDQLTDMQRLLFDYVAQTKFGGDMAQFLKFSQGSELAVTEWDSFFNDLGKLRSKCTTMLLAHAATSRFDDPSGPSYNRYELDLFNIRSNFKNVDFRSTVKKCCSDLAFLRTEIQVAAGGKAIGGYNRIISFSHCAAWDAKSRWNLSGDISLGVEAYDSAKVLRGAIAAAAKSTKNAT